MFLINKDNDLYLGKVKNYKEKQKIWQTPLKQGESSSGRRVDAEVGVSPPLPSFPSPSLPSISFPLLPGFSLLKDQLLSLFLHKIEFFF